MSFRRVNLRSDAMLRPICPAPCRQLPCSPMIERISRDRLKTLLDRAEGRRVAVVGDAMLDVYLRGEVERISPEAPVPVVRVRGRKYALGGAANVAQNVVAIGARCDLVATVGQDSAGAILRETLHRADAAGDSLV